MFGNWASGSVNRETTPARVMTMDSTEAKIGRSIKNREITTEVSSLSESSLEYRLQAWRADRDWPQCRGPSKPPKGGTPTGLSDLMGSRRRFRRPSHIREFA